jgi:RNA polymerase sigma factor (sigma-70 family)
MTTTDQDLQALPDSPSAVARLVANHREFLGFLQSRVGSRALAEDILQDAFVRGIGKLDSLRDDESAVAWFYRILRNAVDRSPPAPRGHGPPPGRARGGARRHGRARHELRGAVCQCVARLADNLKPEYSEALRRIEVDGLAVKDYAAEVGITSNNAAVRVFRAREALKKQVARSCGTCAEHGCLDCTCGAGHCGSASS